MTKDYSTHYQQFERIDPAKRDRVLKAALEEFSKHDYPQVSTNAIVKRAGISKGLLFHYFGDKGGLFLYLLEKVTSAYTKEVMDMVGLDTSQPNDVFDVMKLAVNSKLEVARRYLADTRFVIRAIKGDLPAALREQVDAWVGQSYNTMSLLANSLDENLLKEGIDKQRLAKIIEWVCEGITNEAMVTCNANLTLNDFQELAKDVNVYFDFLRMLVYKHSDEVVNAEAEKPCNPL